ncbi:hypothetical protein [Bradyrhizobium sp. CCBAU 21359]|uniref:hypothetical protein n=1 Tax=Bradyrhizobium sp. CCBAU 21359 TaxID=1325080 RepID=UPI002305E425|nr:hypothetical protein [Bradyrhizobium sp. CCBAU 21359]
MKHIQEIEDLGERFSLEIGYLKWKRTGDFSKLLAGVHHPNHLDQIIERGARTRTGLKPGAQSGDAVVGLEHSVEVGHPSFETPPRSAAPRLGR